MILSSKSIQDGQPIGEAHAFCKKGDPVEMSTNLNPHLAWSDVPPEAKSLVLLVVDKSVPSEGTNVNKEGVEVSRDLARVEFSHWVLIDIPATVTEIQEGVFSSGIVAGGKPGPEVSIDGFKGAKQGINDYTGWFAGDADMAGEYFGYDGPCPPWNDPLIHEYFFTVYALDIETLGLTGAFTRGDVTAALEDHIVGEASLVGTYSLYKG